MDHQARGLAILRQNLDVLGFKERSHIVRGDVVRWLEASPDQIKRAGLVFLDPPYDDVVLDHALRVLDRTVDDTTVVAEHSRRQKMPSLARLALDRQRRYGDTMVTLFRAPAAQGSTA